VRRSLSLDPIRPGDRSVLERLWQLHHHDLSEFRGEHSATGILRTLPDEDGAFNRGRLLRYADMETDPDRAAYLFRLGEHPAGFAFIRGLKAEPRLTAWMGRRSSCPRARNEPAGTGREVAAAGPGATSPRPYFACESAATSADRAPDGTAGRRLVFAARAARQARTGLGVVRIRGRRRRVTAAQFLPLVLAVARRYLEARSRWRCR
jgi:hypothetical protein